MEITWSSPQERLRTQMASALPVSQETLRFNRILGIGFFFGLLFVVIFLRLTFVMLAPSPEETHAPYLPTAVSRAKILDRQGEILAINLIAPSLYINAKEIIDPEEVALALHKIFPEIPITSLRRKAQSEKSFIWIKRHLSPKQQQLVHTLGLPGLYFQKEERRFYPYGEATGHVIGHTNLDLQGSSGLERQYNQEILSSEKPLELTLDIRVQTLVRKTLLEAIKKFQAKGANALVMKTNGEIIAMVSLPDFNPHSHGKSADNLFNANTMGLYEMGSIFKIFTLAMSLDSGKVDLNDSFDASRPYKLGRFMISDYKGKNRRLSVPEIFMYSSNIGCLKMMQVVGKDNQLDFFERLGFFQPVPIDYPEKASSKKPSFWPESKAITASYGYGIAVTPLHFVRAIASIVNGGTLVTPTFQRRSEKENGHRIISAKASDKMRRLLHLGATEGTATRANVTSKEGFGYVVGGKTGTANKTQSFFGDSNKKRGYNKKNHLASVVTVFPMHDPQYIILVSIDSPKGTKETFGYSTGGWTAAPIAKEIISGMGPLMGVLPVNERCSEIRSAMHLDIKTYAKQATV